MTKMEFQQKEKQAFLNALKNNFKMLQTYTGAPTKEIYFFKY